MNKTKLLIDAVIKYISGIVLVSLLLFLPAGTVCYPNGWLFMLLLFLPMFILGVVLFVKSPELLEKRLKSKEKRDTQSKVVSVSALAFVVSFIMAGLDYRFEITIVSDITVIISSFILLISYGLYAEVMRENAYLSRTIEVQNNQKVVDTGLYGIVRHPMYMATIFLFLSIPLILGSWISFTIMLIYPIIIIARIKDEEALLEGELKGYIEYKNKNMVAIYIGCRTIPYNPVSTTF